MDSAYMPCYDTVNNAAYEVLYGSQAIDRPLVYLSKEMVDTLQSILERNETHTFEDGELSGWA